MIERGALLAEHNHPIDLANLFPSLCEPTHPLNLVNAQGHIAEHATDDETLFQQWLGQGLSLEEFERRLTKGALEHTRSNVSQAARLMGLSRAQMMYRVDKVKQ